VKFLVASQKCLQIRDILPTSLLVLLLSMSVLDVYAALVRLAAQNVEVRHTVKGQ
jgi:hypothetical protein